MGRGISDETVVTGAECVPRPKGLCTAPILRPSLLSCIPAPVVLSPSAPQAGEDAAGELEAVLGADDKYSSFIPGWVGGSSLSRFAGAIDEPVSQLCTQWCQAGSLELATMGAFTQ